MLVRSIKKVFKIAINPCFIGVLTQNEILYYLKRHMYLNAVIIFGQFSFSRFLQAILNNIAKGLHARIELGKKTEEQQKLLVERQQKKIEMLTEECKQVLLGRNAIEISVPLLIYVIFKHIG